MLTGTPKKLRDGSWGAMVNESGSGIEGFHVAIRTKSGKEWTAVVDRIVWTDGKKSIVTTRKPGVQAQQRYAVAAQTRSGRPRRGPSGECVCGGTDDLLSLGYRPGARVKCEDCGGWGEAI
jgi:hypothetical protein